MRRSRIFDMSQKRLEWKVGLFVLLCLVLLGLLVLNFSKGLTFFTATYTLRLKTTNVGGIKREAAVLMAGVPVGNVTDAELSPGGTNVTVFLKILNRYQIHGDAVFAIDSMGFLGDQYVAIIPGKNAAPVLNDGDEVVCREPVNLQEGARSALGFMQRIHETVKSVESSSEMMKSLLSDLQAGKGLAGRLLKNEELSSGVSQLVSNLTVLSSNLNRHGLLWKPKKTEPRPPSPLYPGRDPWR